MEWISAKDRLPTGTWHKNFPYLSEEVLVVNSVATIVAFYNRNQGQWFTGEPMGDEWIDKITHWMPLPKSPHLIEKEK